MRYCQRCIIPETRPNIELNAEGICNACLSYATRREINWEQRERAFRDVVEYAKLHSRGYDCLIPISGGKDSYWQVVKCLEYGLNPLAVTWKTPARTALGAQNLANLVSMGVDHIDYQVSPDVERKFLYQALVRYGATGIPQHMAIFHIPLKIAVKFSIPLVVWGENSAFEYGGTEDEHKGFRLDSNWVRQYGATHGTRARDWVSDELTEKELTAYFGPSDQELEDKGVQAVFLGYYFPWDVETSLRIANEHGFQRRSAGPKTGFYDYADIDCDFISIHHYMKWFKFGFTRAFDNLSLEIRNNRMTREDAIEALRASGDETPYDDIVEFCKFVGISQEYFFRVAEKFRNQDIWTKRNGKWEIKDFLVPEWNWT